MTERERERAAPAVNPEWKITPKHNLRFPNALWEPVERKVKRLKNAGYPTSVTDVLRRELARTADETDAETVARLGLEKVDRK